MNTLQLVLTPVGTLVFREGRAFDPGDLTDAYGTLHPTPFTLSGAVRGALLATCERQHWSGAKCEGSGCRAQAARCAVERLVGTAAAPGLREESAARNGAIGVLGPYVLVDGAPVFPVPSHVVAKADALDRAVANPAVPLTTNILAPTGAELGTIDGFNPRALAPRTRIDGDFTRVPGWISREALQAILRGGNPQLRRRQGNDSDRNWWLSGELVVPERRAGIGIDDDSGLATSGELFFSDHARLARTTSFGGELRAAEDLAPLAERLQRFRALPLGGDGLPALLDVQLAASWAVEEPSDAEVEAAEGLCLILLQPAWFGEQLWCPSIPHGSLVGATCDRSVRIGGYAWGADGIDQRANRSFVPAGSVFFFGVAPEHRQAAIRACHEQCISLTPLDGYETWSLSDHGFGHAVVGLW